MPSLQPYLPVHRSVAAHLHTQHQKVGIFCRLQAALSGLQPHNRHNIFYRYILLHTYLLKYYLAALKQHLKHNSHLQLVQYYYFAFSF